MREKKGSGIQFHFAPTNENVADFVTRDISLKCFLENLTRWRDGPARIVKPCSSWPVGVLDCIPTGNLSPDNALVCSSLAIRALPECPLDISKYSSLSKLLGVMIKIKEAIQRFGKLPVAHSALKK